MKSRALIKQQSKDLLKGNWGKAVVMVLIIWLSFGVWLGGSMGLLMSGNFGMGALFFVLFIPVIVMVGAGVQYVFLDWVRQGKLADDWFKQIWQVFSDHRLAGKVIRVKLRLLIRISSSMSVPSGKNTVIGRTACF